MTADPVGAVLLTDTAELWFRQARPGTALVDRGTVGPLAFQLESGSIKLSGARSTKRTARGAFFDRAKIKGRLDHSTWALSVGEIDREELHCWDDSGEPGEAKPPGHAYIDFDGVPIERIREVRITFARLATERGLQYACTQHSPD